MTTKALEQIDNLPYFKQFRLEGVILPHRKLEIAVKSKACVALAAREPINQERTEPSEDGTLIRC